MSSLSEQISELQRTATYQRYRADHLRSDVICLREEIAALKKALAELLDMARKLDIRPKDSPFTKWDSAVERAEVLLGRKEGT